MVEIRGCGLAARGCTFIRTNRSVALDQPHTAKRDREFLCHQLRLYREHPLAEVTLSRISRDCTVRADGDPRIEPGRIDVRRMCIEWPLSNRILRPWRGHAETHHQRAGCLQEV